MIFTEPMKKITVVVLAKDRVRVSEEILRLGNVDLRPVDTFSGSLPISRSRGGDGQGRYRDLRKRIEAIVIEGGGVVPQNSQGGELPNLDDVDTFLDKCDGKMRKLRDKQRSVHEQVLWNREIKNYLLHLKELPHDRSGSTILVERGSCNRNSLEKALSGIPYYLKSDDQGQMLLITLRRNRGEVQRTLHEVEWEDGPFQEVPLATIIAELDRTHQQLQEQLRSTQQDIEFSLRDDVEPLTTWWHAIRFEELQSRVENHFGETKKSVVFSGWIPKGDVNTVQSAILTVTNGQALFEVSDPDISEDKEEPPVEMKNAPIIRSFESLVVNYDVPSYGSIDPTPFVAIAYLLMFGMMFGDFGNGLVVFLVGLMGVFKAKKSSKDSGIWNLFVYCGVSSMVFGVLFGSYFGFQLFPPVWIDYHSIVLGSDHPPLGLGGIKTINGVFGLTILFGVFVISVGLIINWINLYRKKDWFHLLLDKSGFLGGWVYGFGFYTIYTYVTSNFTVLPPSWVITVGLLIPLGTLIIKGPIEKMHQSKHGGDEWRFSPMDIVEFLIMWFVEVLEVCIGFLSHTLSFLRVAGLGISHVVLLSAFFTLAEMVSPGGGYSVMGVFLILFGNVLVIILEGLSAAIQSLRLNYYEFFSRYFSGGGRLYRPISLRGKD